MTRPHCRRSVEFSKLFQLTRGHASSLKSPDASEEQIIQAVATVNFTWLHRNSGENNASGGLESAAKAIAKPGKNTVIWVAAESSTVKAIRKHALLEWGIDRTFLHAVGYWKRGEPDHKDGEELA